MKIKQLIKKSISQKTLFTDVFGYSLTKTGFADKYLAGQLTMYKSYSWLKKHFENDLKQIKTGLPKEQNCDMAEKQVWICWLQGMENAPQIVQDCYASVCYWMKDWKITVITADNMNEYVQFPDYIVRKWKERRVNKMNTTLLIMAAGIGSRFGTGIKQLEPVDASNHIIMDYSIHDAIEAGFNHVVFIIRKDIEKEFKEVIGDRIASICASHGVTVDYAFQDINDIPGALPEGRTKPWGTGQAVLAAKNVIDTPFIVINADDYYGKEGFKAVHEYLVNGGESCMAGFVLKNTLSDNGGVTRGICKMDENGNLTEVVETKNIVKTADGAEADGVIVDVNSLVSMNMWGLTPDFLDVLEEGFKEFFEKEVPGNPLKAEYLIPIFIGELLEQGKMSVKVLKTNDTWYGMTYHEDVAAVKDSFKKMLEKGGYKTDLFSDL